MYLLLKKAFCCAILKTTYGGIMSKKLIMIISICALVVLCPLVILGISLMSTEAVGCTLTISGAGIEKIGETDFGGKTSKVSIMIDGKEQKSTKLNITKSTLVTVTYEGIGYDFVGWFSGEYNEINREGNNADKAVSYKTSYTFEIKKNTVLTAVRDVKTYNVTYEGKYDDNSTSIRIDSKVYAFNEPLATAEAKNANNVLAGWHEYDQVEDLDGANTKVANFENTGDVILYPTWERQYAFDFAATANYVLDSNGREGDWYITATKDNVDGQTVIQDQTMMYFMENPTVGYFDLNGDVCEYFLKGYSNYKSLNGNEAVFKNIVKVYYQVDGSTSLNVTTVDLNSLTDGVLSFADVFDYVKASQSSLDNVSLICLRYIFEEVKA